MTTAFANERRLYEIAHEIFEKWPNVNYAALPYLEAMMSIDNISDDYFADSAKSVVLYFLSNATTWRGEDARRIKNELRAMAGIK